jgi:hypothetical protein
MDPSIVFAPGVTGLVWGGMMFAAGIFWLICWTVVSLIRGRQPGKIDWPRDARNLQVPPMFEKLVDKAMAERDATIGAMQERIEVLEKIVTETHRSHSLSEEIEKLRDKY